MPARVEGQREGDWILLDYIDAVVHLFTPEARCYYRLDGLWGQVPAIEFAARVGLSPTARATSSRRQPLRVPRSARPAAPSRDPRAVRACKDSGV